MRRPLRNIALVSVLLGAGTIVQLAQGADAKIEAEAKKADGDAMDDWLGTDYKGAQKLLEGAVKKCGKDKCSSELMAAIHRDLGIVYITNGDKKGGQKEFDAAFTADSSVTIDKDYLANPDVKTAWEASKKFAGGTATTTATTTTTTAPTTAPTIAPDAEGDLELEFKVAPIGFVFPIVVTTPEGLDVETMKISYKTASAEKYKVLEAKKDGDKWVGVIPCEDTQFQGDVKIYVRAYDSAKDEVDHYGTAKKPALVKLVDKMADGEEAPTFPGGKEPEKCTEKGDCQPGFPCDPNANKKPQGSGCDSDDECQSGLSCVENAEGKKWCYEAEGGGGEGSGGGGGGGKSSSKEHKLWIGVDGQLDFLMIGSAENICKETTWACTHNGVDVGVPDKSDSSGKPTAIDVEPPGGGKTSGGPALGTIRAWFSLDYFLSPNLSLGGRVGYAFNGNPTENAKFFPFHLEARAQYFFGEGPIKKPEGLKPYLLGSVGMAEFDAAVPDIVAVPHDSKNADDPAACSAAVARGDGSAGQNCRISGIKAYRLAGRGFVGLGAGIWYMLGPKVALNLGVKLLMPIPTFSLGIAPELGIKIAL